jgi:hypothetical protein
MKTLEEGAVSMSNDVAEIEKTRDKKGASEILMQSPSWNSMLFQIFFLAHDQSQSVKVVETEEIDFGWINQHLKMGESVFITYKNRKHLDPAPR